MNIYFFLFLNQKYSPPKTTRKDIDAAAATNNLAVPPPAQIGSPPCNMIGGHKTRKIIIAMPHRNVIAHTVKQMGS